MIFESPFIPGENVTHPIPLGRYLPPLPVGMIRTWLEQNVPRGSWVIDPFCANPMLAIEAAQAGYRVLVSCNNPVTGFMLQILTRAPHKEDFTAALSDFGAARRGVQRLEVSLSSLYLTDCSACGRSTPAQAFLWKRDEQQPYARLYRCPYCGDEGERTVSGSDLERLSQLGSDALHRARALGRISLEKDLVHARASEALDVYLPRPLEFLLTTINRIESLPVSTQRRDLLLALALSAADEGSALWPYPPGRNRPRQLGKPPLFRENNLWLSLENACDHWSANSLPVAFSCWPDLPPEEGGICLHKGRFRNLLPLPGTINPAAAVTVIPRPNQAFWTLSALWSGWLWGREAVTPLKIALERRRYDWQWHTTALHHTLKSIHTAVSPDAPLFGIVTESAPGFLSAALIAACSAGFKLEGIAQRFDHTISQILWKAESRRPPSTGRFSDDIARESVRDYLLARAEPASFLQMFTAAVSGTISKSVVPSKMWDDPAGAMSTMHNSIEKVISDTNFVRRNERNAGSGESGYWWLAEDQTTALPLSDRVEKEMVRYLDLNSPATLLEIDRAMCAQFTGMLTPSSSLLAACLSSYAEPDSQKPQRWHIKEREKPHIRQKDVSEVQHQLSELGKRLGLLVEKSNPLRWKDDHNLTKYQFYLFASSMIGRFVFSPPEIPSQHNILVLPGSRSNLLAFKLRHDHRLARAASAWYFLKFRHVTNLLEQTNLTLEQLDHLLTLDPPTWEEANQMHIFDGYY
jgi:hypothetical protein